ncbi:MAG: hypothetical protein SNJ59_17010 [Aggregatilineales bacterium]
MNPHDRIKPMPIAKVVGELIVALGRGHALLVRSSRSDLGTLVVKEADLTVNMDLTSEAIEERTDVYGKLIPFQTLGALTGGMPIGLGAGLGTERSQDRATARSQVSLTLRIVNVAEAPEPAERPVKPSKDAGAAADDNPLLAQNIKHDVIMGQPPAADRPEPPKKEEERPSEPPKTTIDDARAEIRILFDVMRERVIALDIPVPIKRAFSRGLNQALKAETMTELQAELVRTLDRFGQNTQGMELPEDIRTALDQLAAVARPPKRRPGRPRKER